MKSLLLLLAFGLAATEKLDRTYLPPPGSKFSGGSPGDLQAPLEYPKEVYTTSEPLRNDYKQGQILPEDSRLVPGIERIPGPSYQGPNSFVSVTPENNSPFNYFQKTFKIPTTTTSYAFTQTTTFPSIEGLETTISPITPGTSIDRIPNVQASRINQFIDQGQRNYQPVAPYPAKNIQPGYQQIPQPGVFTTQTQVPGPQSYVPNNQITITDNYDFKSQPQRPYQQSIISSTTPPIFSDAVKPLVYDQKYMQGLGVQPPKQYIDQGYPSSTPAPEYQLNLPSQLNEKKITQQGNIPGFVSSQLDQQSQQIQSQTPVSPITGSGQTAQYIDNYGNIQTIATPNLNISQYTGPSAPPSGVVGPTQAGTQGSLFSGQPNLFPGPDSRTVSPIFPNIQQSGLAPQANFPSKDSPQGTKPPEFYSDGRPNNLQSTYTPTNIPPGNSFPNAVSLQPNIQYSVGNQPSRPTSAQQTGSQLPFGSQQLDQINLTQRPTYGSGSQNLDAKNNVLSFGNAPGSTLGPYTTVKPGQESNIPFQTEGFPSAVSSQTIPNSNTVYEQPNLQSLQSISQNKNVSVLNYQPSYSTQSGPVSNAQSSITPETKQDQKLFITQPIDNMEQNNQPFSNIPNTYRPGLEYSKPGEYQFSVPSTTPASITSSIASSASGFTPQYPVKQGVSLPDKIYSPRPQAESDRNAVILNYESIMNPEGYAYNFDTSNGIHANENGTTINGTRATGFYSYVGDDGKLYSVEYSADENGFRPRGDHIPTPPPIPEAIQRVIEQAEKDKKDGIIHTGFYDDSKYGHKKYQRPTHRRPQIKNKKPPSSLFYDDTKRDKISDDLYDENNPISDSGYDFVSEDGKKMIKNLSKTQSKEPGRVQNIKLISSQNNFVEDQDQDKDYGPASSFRKRLQSDSNKQKIKDKFTPKMQYENEEVQEDYDEVESEGMNQKPFSANKGRNYLTSDKRKYLPTKPNKISRFDEQMPADRDITYYKSNKKSEIQPSDETQEGDLYDTDKSENDFDDDGFYNPETTSSKKPYSIRRPSVSEVTETKYREKSQSRRPNDSSSKIKKPPLKDKNYYDSLEDLPRTLNQESSSESKETNEERPSDVTRYELISDEREKDFYDVEGESPKIAQDKRRPFPQRYRPNINNKIKPPKSIQDVEEPERPKQQDSSKGSRIGSKNKSNKNRLVSYQPKPTTPRLPMSNKYDTFEDKDGTSFDKTSGNIFEYPQQILDEDTGYYYNPPVNKLDQGSNMFPSRLSENAQKSSTVRPFITPNVYRNENKDQRESSDEILSPKIPTDKKQQLGTPPTSIKGYKKTESATEYYDEIDDDEETSTLEKTRPKKPNKGENNRRPALTKDSQNTDDFSQNVFDRPSQINKQYNSVDNKSKARKPEQQYSQEDRDINLDSTSKSFTTPASYSDSSDFTKEGDENYSQETSSLDLSTPNSQDQFKSENTFGGTVPPTITIQKTNKTSLPSSFSTQPTFEYSDKSIFPGSPTIRPGISESTFSRPTSQTRRPSYSTYQPTGSTKVPSSTTFLNSYNTPTTDSITLKSGLNRPSQQNIPSTTYRPNYSITEVTQPSITNTDAFRRPITEEKNLNSPDYTVTGETILPTQQPGFGSTFRPTEQRFGGPVQDYPGVKPAEFGPSGVTTPGYLGPYQGEDFSGPKQLQKFDPQTGYYY